MKTQINKIKNNENKGLLEFSSSKTTPELSFMIYSRCLIDFFVSVLPPIYFFCISRTWFCRHVWLRNGTLWGNQIRYYSHDQQRMPKSGNFIRLT